MEGGFPENLRLHPLDHGNVDGDIFADLGGVVVGQFKPELPQGDKNSAPLWLGGGTGRLGTYDRISPWVSLQQHAPPIAWLS
jgi:hypothetical protein